MEEQALATFNHAAEQARFLREYEWLITNYAMIAFAALVAAPLLVDEKRCVWRTAVSVFAFLLVLAAAYQAERVLWFTNDERNVASARLQEAVHRLPLVCSIRQEHRLKPRSDRPPWVRLGKPDLEPAPPCGTLARPGAGEASQEADSDYPVKPGLGLAVLLGAVFASLIILSRIPCPRWLAKAAGRVQRVLARIGQRTSGGSRPAS